MLPMVRQHHMPGQQLTTWALQLYFKDGTRKEELLQHKEEAR